MKKVQHDNKTTTYLSEYTSILVFSHQVISLDGTPGCFDISIFNKQDNAHLKRCICQQSKNRKNNLK